MHELPEPNSLATAGIWLYVAELTHRVTNEYASAASALRIAATRASTDEARSAILEATRRLGAFAAAHALLRPPIVAGQVDFAEHLLKLSRAVAAARFQDRPVNLSISETRPIMLDTARCWKAGLVVSELITNAARHAFTVDGDAGEIEVNIAAPYREVMIEVRDTGTWAANCVPGLGSELIRSLAADLDGKVDRRSCLVGTSVVFTFPMEPNLRHNTRCVDGIRAVSVSAS